MAFRGHPRPITVPYGTTSVNIWRERFLLRLKIEKILNEKFITVVFYFGAYVFIIPFFRKML
jgi:hypothetical protein